jgi:glycerophosphoryl diester phosphodiesterase
MVTFSASLLLVKTTIITNINKMRKVVNIAHRGYHRDFPENTLEAFEAAVLLGADGIEFDVHETVDGEFFVFHDDYINGRKLAGMTADEVCKVRIKDEYIIPSLEDALEACGGEMILMVELKQVRSLKNFMEVLRSGADMKMVVIVSFSRNLIKRLAAIAPDVMKAVIGGKGPEGGAGAGQKSPAGVISMKPAELDADSIAAVHADQGLVFVWDCTDADSVRYALNFEIDGIISDYPDLVIEKAMHEN